MPGKRSEGTQRQTASASLKTDETLLRRLRAAASAPLTAEEIDRQRVSFIVGTLKSTSGVTRDRVRDVLKKQEGRVKA
jgi:hypothetical protein